MKTRLFIISVPDGDAAQILESELTTIVRKYGGGDCIHLESPFAESIPVLDIFIPLEEDKPPRILKSQS